MSKYTTEVRFILETASGLDESKGAEDIDNIIENSWTSVFYPPQSEKYKGEVIGNVAYHTYICQLILKHYYFREIGAETVGLWKTWMRTKLQEISKYYAKLWESDNVLSATRALMDTDLKRMHSGESEEGREEDVTGSMSGTDTNTRTLNTNRAENGRTTTNNLRRYSDTPQGGLNGMQAVESNMYLTEAEINNGDGTDNRTIADTGTIGDSGTTGRQTSENTVASGNRSESFEETIQGLSGKSYSDMLMKYRDTLINIDEKIIGEFEDLFLGLW